VEVKDLEEKSRRILDQQRGISSYLDVDGILDF
jgi:hypothetical protein